MSWFIKQCSSFNVLGNWTSYLKELLPQWTKTNVPNSLRIQFSPISHTTDSTVDISKSKSCSSPQYYHAYTAPEVRKHSTTYPQLWMEWRQTDTGTSHLNSASATPNACAPYDQIGTADIIIKKDLMLRSLLIIYY